MTYNRWGFSDTEMSQIISVAQRMGWDLEVFATTVARFAYDICRFAMMLAEFRRDMLREETRHLLDGYLELWQEPEPLAYFCAVRWPKLKEESE